MIKKLWVVRICVGEANKGWFDNPILDCLRYAGIVNIHESLTPSGQQVFYLFPPKSSWGESQRWAQMNSERMWTFGVQAESCPIIMGNTGVVLNGQHRLVTVVSD